MLWTESETLKIRGKRGEALLKEEVILSNDYVHIRMNKNMWYVRLNHVKESRVQLEPSFIRTRTIYALNTKI